MSRYNLSSTKEYVCDTKGRCKLNQIKMSMNKSACRAENTIHLYDTETGKNVGIVNNKLSFVADGYLWCITHSVSRDGNKTDGSYLQSVQSDQYLTSGGVSKDKELLRFVKRGPGVTVLTNQKQQTLDHNLEFTTNPMNPILFQNQ